MSNTTNEQLIERAHELIEEITNHPSGYDKLLQKALEHNDLEAVHYLVNQIEAELSRDNFYNYNIIT